MSQALADHVAAQAEEDRPEMVVYPSCIDTLAAIGVKRAVTGVMITVNHNPARCRDPQLEPLLAEKGTLDSGAYVAADDLWCSSDLQESSRYSRPALEEGIAPCGMKRTLWGWDDRTRTLVGEMRK